MKVGKELKKRNPSIAIASEDLSLCPSCILLYPPAILKAMEDYPFMYAIGLRDGTVLFIEGVTGVHGDWIKVVLWDGIPEQAKQLTKNFPPCPRGVYVRLSDIVWAADAPYDS
jgi:hypothetical protein